MKKVKEQIDDVKFNIDVEYLTEKYLDIDECLLIDMIKKEYSRRNTVKDEYRKFEIIGKRNVTTTFCIRPEKDIIFSSFKVSVENIVVSLQNILDEINKTLYFYYTQYIKFHFLISQNKNP